MAKDKKMQLLMLTTHLLENQFAIFLLVVAFKGIGPGAKHLSILLHFTTLYLACCLSLHPIKNLQERILPCVSKPDLC